MYITQSRHVHYQTASNEKNHFNILTCQQFYSSLTITLNVYKYGINNIRYVVVGNKSNSLQSAVKTNETPRCDVRDKVDHKTDKATAAHQ